MMMQSGRLRPALMTGAALFGLVLGATAAQAEELGVAEGPVLDSAERERRDAEQAQTARLLADAAELAAYNRQASFAQIEAPYAPEPNLQIANPGTPTTARDPVNITGIGQIVIDTGNGNGSVGLCTASLINPRTVLFAAHCVNSADATTYGRAGPTGTGTAVSIGFSNNNLSAVQQWIAAGANQYASNPAAFLYNLNQVVYNPRSTEPGNSFLYADIALGTLDRPAAGIPTWALLFSALPAPAAIGASGTGYHVNIAGYGRNGTGETGANGGVDFRRRVAENFLGGLVSLDDFQNFLFGTPAGDLPQNLYWIDFDDPRRGTAAASPFDFNSFRDNALPREGGTAPGDSGGPLILDATFSRQVILGVLSGGFSRFFGAQPANGYGSNSFYQPLYLYWDYIAANNPYRYVSAVAGNGNWTDPTRWVTNIDPNYTIIGPDGQLVTGVPTTLGGTDVDVSGKFGQICFQTTTSSDCLDAGSGDVITTANPIGTAGLGNDAATGTVERPSGGALGTVSGVEAVLESQEGLGALTLPPATLANGLPGATNFVPNNVDPVRTTGAIGRYFDVTLSATGTTTLNSTVTIDRFRLAGAGARLNIDATGFLTSLIDITQTTGTMQVNGRLTTQGDYFLLAGGLNGTGTITTPFFTNTLGTISPGASGDAGSIGTLNFNGNVILASGSRYLVDLGANAVSDRIAVTGQANIGGVVGIGSGLTGQVNGLGQRYTILTSTGALTGTFAAQSLSAILSQRFTYQTNAVLLEIAAASYGSVVDLNDPVQAGYAQLLDQNRPNAALASLYGLDFASTDTIRSTFAGLAPVNEQAVRSLSSQTINLLQNVNATRLREADRSTAGGTIAVTGAPLNVLQAGLSPVGQPLGGDLMALQSGTEETTTTEANLPDNVAIFLAGGYASGDVTSLPGFAQETEVSGYYVAGGVEYYPADNTMIGLSGYFNSLEADTPLGQGVDSETFAGSLYARHTFEGGPVIDGQLSIGSVGFDTQRQVQFLGAAQNLTSSSDDLLLSGALGLSYDLESSIGTFSPGIEGRYASVDLSTIRETGGTVALAVERETFTSTQARFGLDYQKQADIVQINANAQLVWEFEDGPQLLAANFAQGIGPNANFALDVADHTWVELGVAANFGKGPFQLGVGFDTTIGRDTAETQVFRGSATYRF